MNQLAESGRQFDLILADPPYGEKNVNRRSTSFAQQLLDNSNLPKLLAPGGRFVLGHTKRDTLAIMPPWTEVKLLKHGDSVMRFFEIVEMQARNVKRLERPVIICGFFQSPTGSPTALFRGTGSQRFMTGPAMRIVCPSWSWVVVPSCFWIWPSPYTRVPSFMPMI